MKNIDFAIERGFRIFENEIKNFHFFMIQIKISKSIVPMGNYSFILSTDNDKILYEREIYIDSTNQRIITPHSHEDPLVEAEGDYMICFQIEEEILNRVGNELVYMSFVNVLNNHKLIDKEYLGSLEEIFKYDFKKYSTIKNQYEIQTDKDCIFRLHLGSDNGDYEEREYFLKSGDVFNFKDFLIYPYVGLQCSYEKIEPEVEEKHIAIGQKSMTLSGVYLQDEQRYEALLPFNSNYQVLFSPTETSVSSDFAFYKKERWTEINNIKDLLAFYKDKHVVFFESSLDFLQPQYRAKKTYGLNKIFSTLPLGKKHIDSEVCLGCIHNAKCVQIVPSGLSSSLFKKNIYLEDFKECEIFKLIEQKIS